jgi:hypothetical protein
MWTVACGEFALDYSRTPTMCAPEQKARVALPQPKPTCWLLPAYDAIYSFLNAQHWASSGQNVASQAAALARGAHRCTVSATRRRDQRSTRLMCDMIHHGMYKFKHLHLRSIP